MRTTNKEQRTEPPAASTEEERNGWPRKWGGRNQVHEDDNTRRRSRVLTDRSHVAGERRKDGAGGLQQDKRGQAKILLLHVDQVRKRAEMFGSGSRDEEQHG